MPTILKQYLFFFGLVLAIPTAQGQPEITRRIEIDIKRKLGDDFLNFPLQEQGTLVMLEQKGIDQGDRLYRFWRFDTTLQQLWKVQHRIPIQYELINSNRDAEYAYFLFQKGLKDLIILEVRLSDGKGIRMEYENIVKSEIWEFEVLDRRFLLAGESKNKPFVLYFHPDAAFTKVLPGLQQVNTYLARVTVDTTYQRIMVVISGRTRKQKNVFVNIYDLEGRRLHTHILENNYDYQLLEFKPYPTGKDQWLLFGSYAHKTWEKVQGVYVVPLRDPEEKPTVYAYDLANFKNYFNFYKKKRKRRMLRKVKRLKRKGKRKRYHYDWFTHPLKEQNGRLFFSTDIYRPNYQPDRNNTALNTIMNPAYSSFFNRSSWLYGYNFNDPFTHLASRGRQRNAPTSYRYQGTFVCAFTKKGVPVWDNLFDLDELSQPQPRRPTAFHNHQDSLAFVEFDEGTLRFAQFYRSQPKGKEAIREVENWDEKAIDTLRIANRFNENLVHWYNNFFLLSGEQKVRTTNPLDPVKRVFYLSKVRYREED